jgi:D-glycero-D-manno-heptose 1,7-bisphosphate phosphatase
LDKPLILLDRDGTLITEQDYLKDPRKVRFLPGSIAGLKRLARAGYPMVVISNQSGIGRGLMTRQDVERVNRRFLQLLKNQGVRLGVYYCPHHPKINCACRKPKLKLVKQAAHDLGLSWKNCISVGDKKCDVAMGRRTGGKGVLVLTGIGRQERKREPRVKPDFIAKNFNTAARWILQAAPKESASW